MTQENKAESFHAQVHEGSSSHPSQKLGNTMKKTKNTLSVKAWGAHTLLL